MKSLSNSNIDIYRSCPRKFKRIVLDGAKPPEDPSIPLDFGTAIHLALETYLEGDEGLPVFEMMLKRSKAFTREADLDKHLQIGTILLGKFKKMHLKHFSNVVSEKRIYGTIEGHAIEGTPDVVCNYKGVPSIVDFKTSNAVYNKDLLYTMPQTKMYAVILKELGVKVEQMVYMVFTKTGEFSIQVLTRKLSDEELKEFSTDLVCEINSIASDKAFRKNPKACHEYNRSCPFIRECFPEFKGKGD